MTPSITTAVIPTQRTTVPGSWALVERAKLGGPDGVVAFAELYRAYHDQVFNYIRRRVWDHPTAEDLTGDVFVKLLTKVGGVSAQGVDFGAWLITLARNRVNDHFKSSRFRRERLSDDPYLEGSLEVDPDTDTERSALLALDRAALRVAITDLTHDQRRCLELRFWGGLTDAQTAVLMRKKAGAIKSLQFRAVGVLRKALTGQVSR